MSNGCCVCLTLTPLSTTLMLMLEQFQFQLKWKGCRVLIIHFLGKPYLGQGIFFLKSRMNPARFLCVRQMVRQLYYDLKASSISFTTIGIDNALLRKSACFRQQNAH